MAENRMIPRDVMPLLLLLVLVLRLLPCCPLEQHVRVNESAMRHHGLILSQDEATNIAAASAVDRKLNREEYWEFININ